MRSLKIILILTINVIIFSCDDKNDSETEPDNIKYSDSLPVNSLNTVRYFTPSQVPDYIQNCPSMPTPQDSSAFLNVDLDEDSINDFVFEAKHERLNYGCGSHCICSYYQISISSLNNSSFISSRLKDNMDYVPIKYDSLEIIEKDSLWKDKAFLLLDSPQAPFSAGFNTCFIGFKIKDYYGWIKINPIVGNGLEIKKYALNLTENNIIKAGQEK